MDKQKPGPQSVDKLVYALCEDCLDAYDGVAVDTQPYLALLTLLLNYQAGYNLEELVSKFQ